MRGQKKVYEFLDKLNIDYEYLEHPPTPTAESARAYWQPLNAMHCKNLFFRNHKGKQHYLVVFDFEQNLNIKELESRLKKGKISFASEKRMDKYLGLKPGSVSPFGLINDSENHTMVFLDKNILNTNTISFHPNDNTATIVISVDDFKKYMNAVGNPYEFLQLYEE